MAKLIGKCLLGLLVLGVVAGCVTIGSQRVELRQDIFATKYEMIKKIVVEEAANNGFSQLTSEVRPSQYNGWNGQLYFSLTTPNGTDQLFVKFKPDGGAVAVDMDGAGTRANPDSAIQAIGARLNKL